MIRYQLRCDADHDFESWFRDSAAYEGQRKKKLVACPVCGSAKVEKAIMAPALGRGTKKFAQDANSAPASAPVETTAAEAPQPVALISEKERELREMLRAVREHVVKNSDYVGDEFATVARQMHEGEVEKRSIYGEASAEEVKSLIEDEIEIHPLPSLPDERN
ncbi:DUF1178 family protein [Starkeya sp. ORNL1]|uniref:DUF1178 family protein n=1 Tax=Starkeya sp. ORNL1 TaxID=2709380 RepID=UPI001463E3DD|nr:DUF1178 family protein [Starkeya sp. ORNL1]QJP16664.1 DUF1178 family protein [Starkeya sp. ORNL1]